MSDINIQTSAQTALYWSRHGENDDTKAFGADPSIGSFSIEVETDELGDYGTREVVNREVTNVTGTVSVTVTATHFWWVEYCIEKLDDGNVTDNGDGTYTWNNDESEEYFYIDLTIANTRSGEDYVLKKCGVDVTVSMSSPYGGGDQNVEVSFDIDVSNPEKIKPATQDEKPTDQFSNADALYFKNAQIHTPDPIGQKYFVSELEFTVSNNDEGLAQIPVICWDSDITELSADLTPETDNSVGVQTQTVDTGEVVLYDTNDTELGRADANSSSYQAVDVGGTDVHAVKLVRAGEDVDTETISVNGETDGTGLEETADVDTTKRTQGGIQDVTRSAGARDFELTRTILRSAEDDEELDRILDSNGVPDGSSEEYDLTVEIGNDIVNGEVTSVSDIHHINFQFKDLFPDSFDWSGFDERGGDISEDLSDLPTSVDFDYTVGTNTRP